MKKESDIETYFIKQVKNNEGITFKWRSPSNRGVPDRIVFFKDIPPLFVELKAPDGRIRALQKYIMANIKVYYPHVYVLNSIQDVDKFIIKIKEELPRLYIDPDLIEIAMRWETVCKILDGEKVSDFALSFPETFMVNEIVSKE